MREVLAVLLVPLLFIGLLCAFLCVLVPPEFDPMLKWAFVFTSSGCLIGSVLAYGYHAGPFKPRPETTLQGWL